MNKVIAGDPENGNYLKKELAATCGLYCGACGVYQATQANDTDRILQYAMILSQSYDETLCDGCGADRKSLHCSKMCSFIDCTTKKGISFCGECTEFPCPALLEFKSKMPHRTEILESLNRRKEVGTEPWLREMKTYFSCPECQTVNSSYHVACRKCGYTPGSNFAKNHRELIEKYLAK